MLGKFFVVVNQIDRNKAFTHRVSLEVLCPLLCFNTAEKAKGKTPGIRTCAPSE